MPSYECRCFDHAGRIWHRAAIYADSVSAALHGARAMEAARMGARIEIWTGGRCVAGEAMPSPVGRYVPQGPAPDYPR